MADTPNDTVNNSIADYIESMSMDIEGTLKSIDLTLRAIARKDGLLISQSSLQDLVAAEQEAQEQSDRRKNTDRRGAYANRSSQSQTNNSRSQQDQRDREQRRQEQRNRESSRYNRGNSFDDLFNSRRRKSAFDDALDGFEKSFTKSLFGRINPVSDIINSSVQNLAKKLGTDVNNLGNTIGMKLGKRLGDAFDNSRIGSRLKREWNGIVNRFSTRVTGMFDRFGDWLSDVDTSAVEEEIRNTERPNPAEESASAAQQDETERRYRRPETVIDVEQGADGVYRAAQQQAEAPTRAASDSENADRAEPSINERQNAQSTYATINDNIVDLRNTVDSRFTELLEFLRQNSAATSRDLNSAISESNPNSDVIREVIDDTSSRVGENVADNLPSASDIQNAVEGGASGDTSSASTALSTFVQNLSDAGDSVNETTERSLTSLGRSSRQSTALIRRLGQNANAEGALVQTASTDLTAAAESSAGALGGISTSATEAGAAFPALTLGLLAVAGAASIASNLFQSAMQPLKEGWGDFAKGVLGAANRTYTQTKEQLTNWQKRMKDDIISVRQAEFDIIKDAANKVTDVWDNILTTVAATQGYTKAGVQDLWSNYAQRLTEEGKASVVSSADIMDKLNSVLQKGLSGAVAEEFAYVATILGNAIPTEDFFQYAETYSSIAANAIRMGASQEEAIQKADEELYSFASNLLFASKQIAGGFSTSLTNAGSLFEDSAKIAMSSAMANAGADVSDISGVLTAVAAAVGSIAPDLASSLTGVITSLATGGNSSELTALRSLAGVGASNTAFLKALSQDPQKVFADMFGRLAELQHMSAENFMEVSEGLSGIFGMSMDAFARVDFAYLADAIASMNLNNSALAENMDMLVSGQTTSTESQLRMQKVNQYMVEEGLAYVLDNEVARSIQEHMWEEQLANDLQNNTYAVELVGGTASLLNGLWTSVNKVFDIINPFRWFSKVEGIIETSNEADYQRLEIEDILNYGRVGKGNTEAQYNLLHGDTNLGLTDNYLQLISQGAALSPQQRAEQLRAEQLGLMVANGQIILPGTEWAHPELFTPPEAFSNLANSIVDAVNQSAIDKAKELSNAMLESTNAVANMAGKMLNKVAKAAAGELSGVKDISSKYIWSTVGKGAYQQRVQQAEEASASFYIRNSESGIWKSREDALDQAHRDQQNAARQLFASLDESLSTYITTRTADVTTSQLANATKAIAVENADAMSKFAADTMSYTTQAVLDSNGRMVQAVSQQHRDFYTQSELIQQVMQDAASKTQSDMLMSFDDWIARFEADWNKQQGNDKLSYKKIDEILSEYGSDISMLERAYAEQETAQSSAAARARELHEVQFWEDMQQFATKDFPWYMREWERYYIQHEAYGQVTAQAYGTESDYAADKKTNSQSIGALFSAEHNEEGDAVISLAKVLTDNSMWQQELGNALKDPTLQTNALLSKILLVVEAIMQQNNETSIVSVPTSLSSLGLGVTNI